MYGKVLQERKLRFNAAWKKLIETLLVHSKLINRTALGALNCRRRYYVSTLQVKRHLRDLSK